MDHFIETVRKYPCLWNTNAIEYRDQELKDAAWTEVMKETDLSSVKEVKLKWKKLRDSYRDALKRQSEMHARDPGNSSKKPYHWKYMVPMQFLQPFMGARKKPDETTPTPAVECSYSIEANGHARGGAVAFNGKAEPESDESESEAESEPRQEMVQQAVRPEYVRPRAAKRPRFEFIPQSPTALIQDPLDIFFNSMCQSTKRFPFHMQIKIKKTLFNAVIEAEETLLAEQQSYASLWARQRSSSSSDAPTDKPS